MKSTVKCTRCEKPMFHYGPKQTEYFCETVRCESTEPIEKRPGPVAKQESQTAQSNSQEKEAAMNQSTPASDALTAILSELLGPHAEDVLPMYLPMKGDVLMRRLSGQSTGWTVDELRFLAEMIGVTPARLMSSMTKIVNYGASPQQAAVELAKASQPMEVPA